MAAGTVTLPAQGVGSSTPAIAVDTVAGKQYQLLKLVDGTVDGTTPAPVTAPTDGVVATRAALWVGSELMVYDATNNLWNRARGTITNGVLVDVSRVQGGNVTIDNAIGSPVPVNVVAGGSGGGGTPALAAMTHTVVAVGTSSTLVRAANASRRYLLIENVSDVPVYLAVGVAAVVGNGIQINAGGGAYEMSLPYGNLSLALVNGIHGGTGTKTLLVTEGT